MKVEKRNGAGSETLFNQMNELIPGGVNSPVRAFGAVGGSPFVVKKGSGPWLYDIDGNRYLDYVMSWGPLILGHAFPGVIEAIKYRADSGCSFGAPTRDELILAEHVIERMPHIEKLRLVSSGTEACMTAARIARGTTGREIIVKFDGGYHGHSDLFLVQAGSGLATGGLPASAGVPKDIAKVTVSIPYNNFEALDRCFAQHGPDIAGVIVEPVAANMGVIPPAEGFLQTLRDKTTANGSVLIFDEVITGFRVAPGGAAELFNIRPDLVCLGKILGGGMPVGAVGGKKELMDNLAPLGGIYQAGTLSGNPLSTVSGIATLKELGKPNVYEHLKQYTDDLTSRMEALFEKYNVSVSINKVESLFTLFFTEHEVRNFEDAKNSDMKYYAEFFRALLERGIYIAPSGFEAWFVSLAHKKEQTEMTLKAVEDYLKTL
ncbi:MAG: glutamate-1-semialdehyde 2,1-aminomutase [candidate division Zixibacteria bacterium]|nr:glutamate-1-semialdehyde 2,1-aminomutase [candidate division Zixibacteria bacterium]